MRYRTLLVLASAVGAASHVVACSSDDGSSSGTSGDDGGSTLSPDAGARPSDAGATPADALPSQSSVNVRVAHLSPDAPAVDFCLAAHGSSTFTGPVLKGASLGAGLTYASVTAYLQVPAGQYDVRLVAPGAPNCSTPLASLPDFTSLPTLPAGASVTIAAEGEVTAGGTPFGLTAYVDDADTTSSKAKLRFVHASPGTPSVDVGTGAGSSFAAIFSNVAFGAIAASGAGIDANGYLETDPLVGVELSARAHGGTSDALVIPSASLPAGAIATAFAIGKLASTTKPLGALLCVDNAPAANGLAACTIVGDSLSHLRIAHLSPDAPAVDVCLKSHSSSTWPGKPLLQTLNVSGGLTYPQVTAYVDVAVDAYDVRIVLASATDCSTNAVPDTDDVAVSIGLHATVAATGDLAPAGTDPSFALKILVDDRTVTPGKAKLRFVHASPSTPNVDVGIGTGATFTKLFANVPFGGVAAAAGAIDANGFLETTPLSNVSVTARVANATSDALTVPGVSLAANEIATAFAIGGKTGASANPLKVLLCDDSAAPTGALTTCLPPAP